MSESRRARRGNAERISEEKKQQHIRLNIYNWTFKRTIKSVWPAIQ